MRPSASPSSKCCFGWKENFGGVPTLRSSTLAFSSAPIGTSAAGRFGMAASRSRSCLSSLRSFSSPSWIAVFSDGHLGHQLFSFRFVLLLPSPCRYPWTPRCGGLARPASPGWRRGVPRPVQKLFQDGVRRGLEAAVLQALEKGVLIVANPSDVEQGAVLGAREPGRCFRIENRDWLVIAPPSQLVLVAGYRLAPV